MKAFFDTDKVWPHGYYGEYLRIAARLGPSARVCELGVSRGESLRLWQALFPLGHVTGVDANPDCTWPDGTTRIVADHSDRNLPAFLTASGPFDLIVDDGNHDGGNVRKSFRLLWPLLAPGGFYVVEDWMIALRPSERPGETWGGQQDDSMLEAVRSFLPLLRYPDSECDQVTYRYGLAIVHKRSGA